MTTDEIMAKLLANRGLVTPTQIDNFFNPAHPQDIVSPFATQPAIDLVARHVKNGNRIAVYGDYDVDGICSTAILWETVYQTYPHVFPHIPHREKEGYGLSVKGIDHCLAQGAKLIIAVDNGIVAFEQIAHCQSRGCDIIVIDHHEPSSKLPTPNVLLHSTSACATALTWFFCRDLLLSNQVTNNQLTSQLGLAAVATICDLVPLLATNRSFAKHGLVELNHTTRPGLLALFAESGLLNNQVTNNQLTITPYHVSFIIGPRLNAMGRLEHAIDSLRLLCTKDPARAQRLAQLLSETNRQRQQETDLSIGQAMNQLTNHQLTGIIFVADTSYHPGVIGLIASKLVETHWRPSIVVAIGETVSKGSARSVPGFDITDFLRAHQDLFADLGGHAMACGFTIPTDKIDDLAAALSQAKIDPQLFVRQQRVDLEIPLSAINYELTNQLTKFEPYGLGNPTPVFKSTNLAISNVKSVGKENKHLKFRVQGIGDRVQYDAIWFNAPKPYTLSPKPYTLTYSLEKDTWNGQERLQLIVKDATV